MFTINTFDFLQTFPAYTFFCEKLKVVTVLNGVRHDHESINKNPKQNKSKNDKLLKAVVIY